MNEEDMKEVISELKKRRHPNDVNTELSGSGYKSISDFINDNS